MGHEDHHEKARGPVTVFIVTVSDTRTLETDKSGAIIEEKLLAAGHEVAGRKIAPDEPERIGRLLDELPGAAQAVIINGGTGVSKRDRTYDVLEGRLEKTLPGFGEIFRMLSYEEIGPAAIMSRAAAGISEGRVLISIPGSSGAVKLAMEKIIIPELAHMVWEAAR
jgi:molybdenum cofactor biosynthesis protein B